MTPTDLQSVPPPEEVERAALQSVLKRFEAAWAEGHRPTIEDYLPAAGQLRHPLLIELVHIDLKLRLQTGEVVPVEEYLGRYPELAADRDAALQLIAAEYRLRQLGEPQLVLEDYFRRFPHYAGELPRLLAQVTTVGDGIDRNARRRAVEPDLEGLPVVPGYEVLGPLGRGGMGTVYRARQLNLNRLVALKFLPGECAGDPLWLERFRREACTASALNHPHICTIYGTGECSGRPFLSMELIEGQTLEEVVRQRPPVAEAARLVGQVARALEVAHAAGVVHRDIKPANLMVRADGIVKVLDFGLARRLPTGLTADSVPRSKRTDPGTLVGTVRYMAPEQARGEPVTTAADVFALGIVFCELATGQHPFPADSEIGVLHAILSHEPLPPSRLNPEIPSTLDLLIQHMLARDPRLRPTAAEVGAALAEMNRPGGSPREGPPRRSGGRLTVGRQQERAALRAGFESAAAGRGGLLCVTGEPGLGKTTLIEEFLDDLTTTGRDCAIARGRCSERLAGAEAYLPFLEALDNLLQGADGPSAAQVMRLVAPTWYAQLAPQATHDPALARVLADARAASQERRKRELGVFLDETSRRRPLVLFLDDVHWADPSSVDLLAYLGGKWAGWRFLLVVAYRPSDLLLSRHPFGPVKLELQGRGVCREIALPFLSRADLDRYLALAFPGHQFPEEFAAVIHARTEGNPLFLIDLLRYLQDRGRLIQDEGCWVLAQAVPDILGELPESVRGMIQRKLEQLSDADRRLLMAASVQGHEFDSAVVARVLGLGAADVEERLGVLERVHFLVRVLREQEFPDQTLTLRCAFVHVLYQNALYASLAPTRKAGWSAAAAQALLEHYGPKSAAVATELALLFEAARDPARAAHHFLHAAENAVRAYANQEAMVLARRGLGLLATLPDTPERARQELGLQMALSAAAQATRGYNSSEADAACSRARALCEQLGDGVLLFPVLWRLALCYLMRAELPTAQALAEQCLRLGQGVQDPALCMEAHIELGAILCYGADNPRALEHCERASTLYDAECHASHTYRYGHNPLVLSRCFAAWALWMLGYPDQGRDTVHAAIALARELGHPMSLASALFFAAFVHWLRRERSSTRELCETLLTLAAEQGMADYTTAAFIWRGWALADGPGQEEGLAQIRQGSATMRMTGVQLYRTVVQGMVAELLAQQGQPEEGLAALAEAFAVVRANGERYWEAELYRLQGELLLARAEVEPAVQKEAENSLCQARTVARAQSALSLELRAVTSLSRLYQEQGRQAEARSLLAETCGRFTEGLDTLDLQEARALLGQLE